MRRGDKLFEVTRSGTIREARILNVYDSAVNPTDPFVDFTFSKKKGKLPPSQIHTYHESAIKKQGLFLTKTEAYDELIDRAEDLSFKAHQSYEKWTQILVLAKDQKERFEKKD